MHSSLDIEIDLPGRKLGARTQSIGHSVVPARLFRDTSALMSASGRQGSHARETMLLAFSARNFRSFRDEFKLSLMATRLAEEGVAREIAWREGGRLISVLPAVGIFGANASGKSNLLFAMAAMRDLVINSFRKGSPGGRIPTAPFLLDDGEVDQPSKFAVDLVLEGVRYEYGFVVNSERVLREWARSYPRGRATLLLERDGDAVQLGSQERTRGRTTEEILRPNALFLSTAAATSHPLFLPLFEWFQRNFVLADVQSRGARSAFTTKLIENDAMREQLLELLREADLGITGVTTRERDPEVQDMMVKVIDFVRGEFEGEDLEDFELDEFEIRLEHHGRHTADIPLSQESWGTIVWFGLIGTVVEALRNGTVLLADEVEASLHPSLVNVLVDLFQSQRSNPHRAQLIFNTHEVTLMGDSADRPLGRDQIWLTERDEDGASHLMPLADHAPRRKEALARRYLAGHYGGVPIITPGRFEQIAEPIGKE